jgi:uncharacterized Tic20 family protein
MIEQKIAGIVFILMGSINIFKILKNKKPFLHFFGRNTQPSTVGILSAAFISVLLILIGIGFLFSTNRLF